MCLACRLSRFSFFFFNDTATTEIYTLSLHDALPISVNMDAIIADGPKAILNEHNAIEVPGSGAALFGPRDPILARRDRKSTRLNSSHLGISYAVFCLKKKKKTAKC